jgi:calcineurin-like phosphoesterase family protein
VTIWFTSDTHFGHARIIEYCDRPFYNVDEMNDAIIASFAEIDRNDVLYHLGDVALGGWRETILNVEKIPGIKVLLPGNHDVIHPIDKRSQRQDVKDAFNGVFDEIILPGSDLEWFEAGPKSSPVYGSISHFPLVGSETDPRHNEWYVQDVGQDIHIHGHVHNEWKVNTSGRIPQVNVGWDVWRRPVRLEEILALV